VFGELNEETGRVWNLPLIALNPANGRIHQTAGFGEVSIGDNGVGIARRIRRTFFEEFHQVGTAANWNWWRHLPIN
jgi:hypothetical protein